MSRGLGRIQRRILDVLKHEAKPIPTSLLAIMVFMNDDDLAAFRNYDKEIQFMTLGMRAVAPKYRNAVSRACHKLWYDCQVSKHEATRSTWWSLPQPEKPRRKKAKARR